MRPWAGKKFVKIVAAPQLTLALLLLIGVAIASATFVESSLTTASAKAYVYNALWFELVLGLFGLNLLAALTRWWPFRPHLVGFVLIHMAVILILVGAAVTRFMGYEGSMPIREGQTVDSIFTFTDHIRLSQGNQTLHFPTRLHRPGRQNLTREGVLNESPMIVSVEQYWPHYGERFVEAEGGQPAVALKVADGQRLSLLPGDQESHPAMRVRHLRQALVPTTGSDRQGNIVVRVGVAWTSIPVSSDLPVVHTVGDFTVTLSEFEADFGAQPGLASSQVMTNPMVRVKIEAADGQAQERTLFAYHPDFSSSNTDQSGIFAGVQADYLFGRELDFGAGPEGLMGRCSLALTRLDEGGTGDELIPAGSLFVPEVGQVYASAADDFTFTVEGVFVSGVMKAVNLPDSDADAAVRVRVTDAAGESAAAIAVMTMQGGTQLQVGGLNYVLGFGPIKKKLPHQVKLDDFVLITYPGSSNPVDYESYVRLYDEEQGIDGMPFRIYMNHPLSHRGFKHFQTSYDMDLGGTRLTVNYDPGKNLTYVGYTLITLGFVLAFFKGFIRRRNRRSRNAAASVLVEDSA